MSNQSDPPGAAAAVGACLYLFILGLVPFHFLIGRSDPDAAVFLVLMMLAGHRLSSSRIIGAKGGGRGGWLGLLAPIVILVNWRFFAVALACGFGFGLEAVSEAPAGMRLRRASSYVAWFAAGSIISARSISWPGFIWPVRLTGRGCVRHGCAAR